jgi:hypothetical protein
MFLTSLDFCYQGFCGQNLGRGASKKRTPFAAILMVNLDHRQH